MTVEIKEYRVIVNCEDGDSYELTFDCEGSAYSEAMSIVIHDSIDSIVCYVVFNTGAYYPVFVYANGKWF